MNNPERKLTGGAAKVQEYVVRVKEAQEREKIGEPGETADQIIAGLSPSFREAVNAELGGDNERDEDGEKEFPWDPNSEEIVPPQFRGMTSEGMDIAWTVTEYRDQDKTNEQKERKRLAIAYLHAKEARQETKKLVQEDEATSAKRVDEIRAELGISTQAVKPVEQPQSVLTGEEQKANEITTAFRAMGEGFRDAAVDKIKEYDERLRAVMAGNPIKKGDTVANLMPDFRRFTKVDWTPDFDLSQLSGEKGQEIVASIPTLENIMIKENDQLAARNFDPSRFELKNENGKVVETFQGAPDYRREEEGRLTEVIVGDKKIKVIFSTESSNHASYEPSRDVYTIGPRAIEEFKQDPERFLSSFSHEAAHDAYFSLPVEKQRSLDDLFLNNDDLRQILMDFGSVLYSDNDLVSGQTGLESYLKVHEINNQATAANLLSKDAFPGIKDFRSASFEFNGSQHEIFLSLLITEMISYMSSLQLGENIYHKVAENGRQRRGGKDPRYDIVAKMFKTINNNPKIKAEIDGYNLFTAATEKGKNDLLAMMENV